MFALMNIACLILASLTFAETSHETTKRPGFRVYAGLSSSDQSDSSKSKGHYNRLSIRPSMDSYSGQNLHNNVRNNDNPTRKNEAPFFREQPINVRKTNIRRPRSTTTSTTTTSRTFVVATTPATTATTSMSRKYSTRKEKKLIAQHFSSSSSRQKFRDNDEESNIALKYYFGDKLAQSLSTPCTFPTPNEQGEWMKCGEPENSRKYNVCDPDSIMSYTKLDVLFKLLDDLEQRNGEQCLCPKTSGRRCWYKFAFAFMKELKFPSSSLPEKIEKEELCEDNFTRWDFLKVPRDQSAATEQTYSIQEAVEYGNKFADILRKRWALGLCEEDILILVVQHAPPIMATSRIDRSTFKPAIFASLGNLVKLRTDHITRPHNFDVKSMDEAVFMVNSMLHGHGENSTLEKGLVTLVTWYEQLLIFADQTFQRYSLNAKHPDHKPPPWALATFGGCGVLLAIMALGSCLVRTKVRRSFARSKQGGDANRHWKAGFVGGMLAPTSKSQDHIAFNNYGEHQRSRSFLDVDRTGIPRLSFSND